MVFVLAASEEALSGLRSNMGWGSVRSMRAVDSILRVGESSPGLWAIDWAWKSPSRSPKP